MSLTISRLRAANPVRVEADRGRSAIAQAALERILNDPRTTTPPRRKRLRARLPRGGVAVALALGLAGGGAAFAATNPFGWWSSNPNVAKYALNPSVHVRTPTAFAINCRSGGAPRLVCQPAAVDSLGRPQAHGQLYTKIDTIHQPNPASVFTRVNFLRAARKLPPAQAAKLRHDLSRVPDSFFIELRLASRYGTYGAGGPGQRVPPPGVPEFLVCEQVGSALSCQDLNGDEHAPVGAGVYSAQPASDWRLAPPQRQGPFLPPGIRPFSRAEVQVLIDVTRFSTSSSGGARVRARPIPRAGS